MFSIDSLVCRAKFFQSFDWNSGVFCGAVLRFDFIEDVLEAVMIHSHHNITEHIDQSAICVICKSWIACCRCHSCDNFIGQTEIQDRVHHAWHRNCGARSHRDQKWIARAAKLLAKFSFEHANVLADLVHHSRRNSITTFAVHRARFGGDRESWRNRQTNRRHVGKICALSTKKQFLFGLSFGQGLSKEIHHLGSLALGPRLRRRIAFARCLRHFGL